MDYLYRSSSDMHNTKLRELLKRCEVSGTRYKAYEVQGTYVNYLDGFSCVKL